MNLTAIRSAISDLDRAFLADMVALPASAWDQPSDCAGWTIGAAVIHLAQVAELLGIRSIFVSYCPIFLPSPHHPPQPLPGRPFPPGETDRRVLDDLEVESAEIVGEKRPEADVVVRPWPSDHRAVVATVSF